MVLLGIFNDSEIIRKLCLTWFALHNMSVIKNIYSDFVIKANGVKYIRGSDIYSIANAVVLLSDPSKFGPGIKKFMLRSRLRRISVCYGAESVKFTDNNIANTTDIFSIPYRSGYDDSMLIMPIYRGFLVDKRSREKIVRTVSINIERMKKKIAWSKEEQIAWLI